MELKYIITGTGRCGTVYVARLLTSVEVYCGHETIFDFEGLSGAKKRLCGEAEMKLSFTSSLNYDSDQSSLVPVEWMSDISKIVADSSYMAAPFLNDDVLLTTKKIHVVRHPVDVINSFCNHINYFKEQYGTNEYENFIYSVLPELTHRMPQYDRAALFYVKWNEMIEVNKPDLFVNVEGCTNTVMEFVGVPTETPHFNDNTVNTYKYKRQGPDKFDFTQIESSEIKSTLLQMSKRYGYQITSNYLFL